MISPQSYLKITGFLLHLLVLDVDIFSFHLLFLPIFSFFFPGQSLSFGFLFFHHSSLFSQNLSLFSFIRMNVSNFIEEIFLFFLYFLVLFFCSEKILYNRLIFFLVLLCLLCAWQFFNKQNVNDFNELILDKFIIYKVENFVRNTRICPIITFSFVDNFPIKIFFNYFFQQS